ncbi:MAG: AMP-binding protein [Pseudomonadota bacterium]
MVTGEVQITRSAEVSVARLVSDIARMGHSTAIVDTSGAQISHQDFVSTILAFRDALIRAGVRRNDVVLGVFGSTPFAPMLYLGTARIAGVLPMSVNDPNAHFERLLEQSKAICVVSDEALPDRLANIASKHGIPVLVRKGDIGSRSDLDGPRVRDADGDSDIEPREDDLALVATTSGTTGLPKLVEISQRSFALNVLGFVDMLAFEKTDISLCMMPLTQVHGMMRCVLPVLLRGGQVVWTGGFDRRKLFDWIDHYQPTFISGVPMFFRTLPDKNSGRIYQSVRAIGMASDRIEASDLEKVGRFFSAEVFSYYGMTETSPLVATSRGHSQSMHDPGRLVPNDPWGLDIVRDDGRPARVCEIGEIVLKGGHINPLLYDKDRSGQAFDEQGRFWTGDLGMLHGDGSFTIHGRQDDRITRAGQKISPLEIEAAVKDMPSIKMAVAFALPDETYGHLVGLAVVPVPEASPTQADVLSFASKTLKAALVPSSVFIERELPLTPTGKISRTLLSKHFGQNAAPASTGPIADVNASLLNVVLETFRKALRDDSLGPEDDFFLSGGDSLSAVDVILKLEEKFSVPIAPARFAAAKTAYAVAHLIELAQDARDLAILDVVVDADSPSVLVVTPGLDGKSYYAGRFSAAFEGTQKIIGIGVNANSPLLAKARTLHDLADHYAELILAEDPGRDHVILGFSYGAHVALATAQAVQERTGRAPLVVVLDDSADLTKRDYGKAKAAMPKLGTHDHAYWLLRSTPPRPYSGNMLCFFSEEGFLLGNTDRASGWDDVATGAAHPVNVPFPHNRILSEEAVSQIGKTLAREMKKPLGKARPLSDLDHLKYKARFAARYGDLQTELECLQNIVGKLENPPIWVHQNYIAALSAANLGDQMVAHYKAIEPSLEFPMSFDIAVIAAFRKVRRFHEVKPLVLKHFDNLVFDHPMKYVVSSMLMRQMGKRKEGERLLEDGLKHFPKSNKIMVKLTERFLETGEYERAYQLVFPPAEALQFDQQIKLLALRAANHTRRYRQAHAMAQKIRPGNADSVIAQLEMLRTHLGLWNVAAAAQHLRVLRDLYPAKKAVIHEHLEKMFPIYRKADRLRKRLRKPITDGFTGLASRLRRGS